MALDPITAGLDLVNNIIDRVWPSQADKQAVEQSRMDMLKAQLLGQFQLLYGQIQANTEQAKSASVFVAGARPFIMWVCGFALAYQFLIRPIFPWVFAVLGHPVPPMPGLDDNLWELTAGTIGMAGWRSMDKRNGVA